MGDSTIATLFDAELNVQQPVEATEPITVDNDNDNSIVAAEPITVNNIYYDMVDSIAYSDSVNELTKESDEINNITCKLVDTLNVVDTASNELSQSGNITNETAVKLNTGYNELVDLLGLESSSKITTESALSYKKEVYSLTTEGALSSQGEFIIALKKKIVALLQAFWEKLKEWTTKGFSILTKQEQLAKDLAIEISEDYVDMKIDKWDTMIPQAHILGNFTILTKLEISQITEYIKFNNNGFQREKLLSLFAKCAEKQDMTEFKQLRGIPIDYDLKSYFKEYRNPVTVPVDISGKTATVLLSYEIDNKGTKETKLEKKVFPLIVDANFKKEIMKTGVLSRADMITTLETISTEAKKNRDFIKASFEDINKIKKIGNNIDETYKKLYVTDLLQCTTLLTNVISISTRVGFFSNGFIIKTISEMAKLYKKQTKTKN